jgi:hypothetical protein
MILYFSFNWKYVQGFTKIDHTILNWPVYLFVNCNFSEVGNFFRNLISDNESFMFWHSIPEILTQNPIRRNHNLQLMSINWCILIIKFYNLYRDYSISISIYRLFKGREVINLWKFIFLNSLFLLILMIFNCLLISKPK